MDDTAQHPQLLRWDEAMELLNAVQDPITSQLLAMANFEVLTRFVHTKEFPASDFDLRFYLEAMKSFLQ